MPVKLTNVYVKSWTINGSADGDTFDFNFTNGEEDPQPAGMLLPAVQAAREAARSSTN